MYKFTHKIIRSLLSVAIAMGGLALASSNALAATPVLNLCATAGTATLTGAVTVPIWGFGIPSTPGDCSTATASLPGPVLSVNEGDLVTINVTNALPTILLTGDTANSLTSITNLSSTSSLAVGMTVSGTGIPLGAMIASIDSPTSITISVAAAANGTGVALTFGHRISIEAPGVNFTPGGTDAVPGGTVSRAFTATNPGTYLYQSAGDAGRQEAMGLYGALIVRSATAGQAYDTATTAYDAEATLVLSQVDPLFNADPDNFDMNNYLATYWLVNGKAYPNESSTIPAPGGSRRLLLRYVNAGYDNTSMMLLGMHERVLARDADLLNNAFDANTETIPAGGTEDAIATVPASGAPSANGFPLFNRNLHVTNGSTATSDYATPGGMLIFIAQ